jgi:predicted Zn-ribbon and HTH transcriptional regulator
MKVSKCPNCGGNNLYMTKYSISGGKHGAEYLPGLGSFFHHAGFYPCVCRDCGLVRFFAEDDALPKLEKADQWQKL